MNYNTVTNGNYGSEENWFLFALKRTERLASALYMVSNLFSDMEPSKWTIRDRMMNILSDIALSKNLSGGDRSMMIDRSSDSLLEILSMVSVCEAGFLLSPMNASILKQEIANLKTFLERGRNVKTETEQFVSNLFEEGKRELGAGYKGGERRSARREPLKFQKSPEQKVLDKKNH